MSLRLVLFGSPAIEHDGESFALPFERRGQLLAFLAFKRSWVTRAELAALLWPEQGTKLAYTNLRKTLFRLQSFSWASAVEVDGGALRFEVETDVYAFESALREGRVGDALPLRGGPLLAGFDEDANEAWSAWLRFERDRLQAAWRDAALGRLKADIDPGAAVELSARLLDADPLDESALGAQLSWLARSGQNARARQAYREFVQRIEQDLGLAPSAELKALHDALGTTSAPRAAVAPVRPPAGDDGFVGRSVELRRMAELLARDDCRLLCLLGPGGVGKTRLAQRAMQDMAPGYPGGAAFIPLEDVASSSGLGDRLARELGVGVTGRAEPLERAIEFLHDRHMLLVLDNFERLAADASVLDRLLTDCARLKIIVTSRVRLATAAAWLMPLEGLPCPEPEDQDRIEAFDAARLFVQAARKVDPALVTAVEAASIVDICRQVEGLPLALQLAAAWTRVLSCEAIAAELRHGTELLHAVDSAHPARHASFDVVFDQSWRLLSAIERDVLARLSVFRGGFSAEAARAVAGASLPVLGALADKSLLRKEGARMQLHPLVQQLAAARLGDGASQAATQSAHAAYFHNLLVQLRPASEDGDRKALQNIDAEFENCRQAWQFSIAQGQAEALTRSVATLLNHFEHRARFEEGLALVRQAIESPLGHSEPALEALMLSQASLLEFRLARYTEAQRSAARALGATRTTRDRHTKFRAWSVLAGCALYTGRLAEARRVYLKALALARAGALAHDTAATLENLALVEKRMGHYAEALRLTIESLVQHRRNGDSASVALCLSNLGSMYMFMNDNESAAAHLQEALALSERDGLVSTRAFVLANLTELALKTNNIESARAHAERALEVADAAGIRGLASWLKVQLARLAVRRGDLDSARPLLSSGSELALRLGAPSAKAAALLGVAELLEAQGQRTGARQVLGFAMDQLSISAPDRDELRAEWARRPAPAGPEPAWPGITLDELLHRTVVESDVAHAPLIALLKGAR